MTKNDETTKSPAKKPAKAADKAPAARKTTRAPKTAPLADEVSELATQHIETVTAPVIATIKPEITKGRYVFATGRRKSAVANVRLFSGKGDTQINRKSFEQYFFHQMYRDTATQPLKITGLLGDFYFTATVNGSGIGAQSQAVRHALAHALGSLDPELRKQMKRAGLLTRDYREKERKKPGLKRARRSPQWAKR